MTEEEAKTKWCPFTHSAYLIKLDAEETLVSSSDRSLPSASATRCIASACMAWRWHYSSRGEKPDRPPGGHCGLAGPRGDDIDGHPER